MVQERGTYSSYLKEINLSVLVNFSLVQQEPNSVYDMFKIKTCTEYDEYIITVKVIIV